MKLSSAIFPTVVLATILNVSDADAREEHRHNPPPPPAGDTYNTASNEFEFSPEVQNELNGWIKNHNVNGGNRNNIEIGDLSPEARAEVENWVNAQGGSVEQEFGEGSFSPSSLSSLEADLSNTNTNTNTATATNAGNNLSIDGDDYRAFSFTATQGVSSAVLAAAGSCNEINNKGTAFNVGAILGALGFGTSSGTHEIADERCQVVVAGLNKMLRDDEQLHELAYLDRKLDHETMMRVLDHWLNRPHNPASGESHAAAVEHAGGILAAAAEVGALKVGLTSAVMAKRDLVRGGNDNPTPEEIYTAALLNDAEGGDSILDKQWALQQAREDARRIQLAQELQVIKIPAVELSNGTRLNIGDRAGDEAAAEKRLEEAAEPSPGPETR